MHTARLAAGREGCAAGPKAARGRPPAQRACQCRGCRGRGARRGCSRCCRSASTVSQSLDFSNWCGTRCWTEFLQDVFLFQYFSHISQRYCNRYCNLAIVLIKILEVLRNRRTTHEISIFLRVLVDFFHFSSRAFAKRDPSEMTAVEFQIFPIRKITTVQTVSKQKEKQKATAAVL